VAKAKTLEELKQLTEQLLRTKKAEESRRLAEQIQKKVDQIKKEEENAG
jgi:hypothetical protein